MAIVLDKQKVVQIGDETTWGTAVAPTIELSGITGVTVKKSIVSEIVQALRGGIVPGRDQLVLKHEVDGCSIEGYVIYEQIAYFLDMLDEVTPAGSGPYTYTYAGPTTAQPTPHPQTLVIGQTNMIYGITGALAKSITFSWNAGEGVKFSLELMGHSVAADTLAALDETASTGLTYALPSHLTVSVDVLAGTIGGTDIDEAMSGSITIEPQRKYYRRAGSLYPTGTYDDFWNVTGELVFENSATTAAYVTSVVGAATSKLIQLDFDNGGTTTAQRALVFQMASEVDISSSIVGDDDDGASVIKLSFKPIEEGDWTTPATGELDGYFGMVSTSSTAVLYA